MKQSPEEARLLENFGPSKFSAEGFLGTDTRSPAEMVTDDARILEGAGTDAASVARALGDVYDRVRAAGGAEITLLPGVTARYFEARGRVPSPFRGEGLFEKGEVTVSGLPGGGELIITRLSIHLIARHGFFQGRGQRYRIEPDQAAALAAGIGPAPADRRSGS